MHSNEAEVFGRKTFENPEKYSSNPCKQIQKVLKRQPPHFGETWVPVQDHNFQKQDGYFVAKWRCEQWWVSEELQTSKKSKGTISELLESCEPAVWPGGLQADGTSTLHGWSREDNQVSGSIARPRMAPWLYLAISFNPWCHVWELLSWLKAREFQRLQTYEKCR